MKLSLTQNCFVEFLNLARQNPEILSMLAQPRIDLFVHLSIGLSKIPCFGSQWIHVNTTILDYRFLPLQFWKFWKCNTIEWFLCPPSLQQSQAQPGCEKLRGRLTMYSSRLLSAILEVHGLSSGKLNKTRWNMFGCLHFLTEQTKSGQQASLGIRIRTNASSILQLCAPQKKMIKSSAPNAKSQGNPAGSAKVREDFSAILGMSSVASWVVTMPCFYPLLSLPSFNILLSLHSAAPSCIAQSLLQLTSVFSEILVVHGDSTNPG